MSNSKHYNPRNREMIDKGRVHRLFSPIYSFHCFALRMDQSKADAATLSHLLNVGSVKVNNRLFCNVTKESFDVSVLLSVRKGVKLKKATLKTEVVDIAEYSVQEHRKTLELCNEIAVLSPESVNLIRCFGFVGREDERNNLRHITKVTEETLCRFDQFIQQLVVRAFCDSLLVLRNNLWNAHDYLSRLGYFPDVDFDSVYLCADWSFKIDCDRALPFKKTDEEFESILARRFSFLFDCMYCTLSPKVISIYRSIRRSDKTDPGFWRLEALGIRSNSLPALQENDRRTEHEIHKKKPYETLKFELKERLRVYLGCFTIDFQAKAPDLHSFKHISRNSCVQLPVKNLGGVFYRQKYWFLRPEFFYEALEEVVEHNNQWKKQTKRDDFVEMVLDACVNRMIPLVDAEISDFARIESANGVAWSDLAPLEIEFLSNAVVYSLCDEILESHYDYLTQNEQNLYLSASDKQFTHISKSHPTIF